MNGTSYATPRPDIRCIVDQCAPAIMQGSSSHLQRTAEQRDERDEEQADAHDALAG